MTHQIADPFDAFLRHITLSDSEKATALERGRRLSRRLEQRPEVRECLITGSMVRSTAIRKFSDVDIVAVIESSNQLSRINSAALVTTVANILRETESDVQVSENAVRVMYPDGVTVDVLGAIHAGINSTADDVYRIPSSDRKGWATYAPEEQNRRIREAAASLGDNFKKLIRLCKWWSKTHGQPASSYEIEIAAHESFRTEIPELPLAIIELFNSIKRSVDIDSPKMSALLESREIAEEAYSSWQTGDVQKSIELWGRLFGEQYPNFIT
ncbi:SMODS domain-containing nucleotidyltransferase [Streptomyces hirsutus]|uniref:SMODS domain-containing nucleotidyltransferase n=1 Tax=Streptomyces hirsutus TaxID=35620 RepID=UPI0036BE65CF